MNIQAIRKECLHAVGLSRTETKIYQRIVAQNVALAVPMAVASTILSVFMILTKQDTASPMLIHAYEILLVTSFIVMAAALAWKEKIFRSNIVMSIMTYLYMAGLLQFGIFFSIVQLDTGRNFIPIMIVTVLIACIFLVRPVITITWVLVMYIEFAKFFLAHDAIKASDIHLILFFFIIVMIASTVRYYTSLRNLELDRKLENLSERDALTHMYNRHAFRNQFDGFTNQNLIVMMVDIDHFKDYNDTYGHAMGDRILETFATLLKDQFRHDNVYRYGGDEFLIVSQQKQADFHHCITQALENLRNWKFDDRGTHITCSGGYVCGYCKNGDGMRHLLALADEQLYISKDNGRDQINWIDIDDQQENIV